MLILPKNWFILFFLVVCSYGMYAQRQISGKVTDVHKEPIPGVNVIVVEVNRVGVQTSFDGEFSIQLPTNSKFIEFSYLGMKTKKIKITDQTYIDVVLEEDNIKLDEIIVIGYNSEKKRNLTGAITKIDGDLLEIEESATIEQALKGKFAGVQVISTDGAPGSGVTLKIRGSSSITAGSAPLYVIDGFPYPVSDNPLDNPLTNLAPGDIDNVTILKDIASTAIYGAEGANGVVLITTKKAKFNQTQWSFKSSLGFSNITQSLPMMKPEDYMSSMMMEFYNRNQYHLEDVDFYPEYAAQIWKTDPSRFKNYQDEVMRTGIRQMYDLSFIGGTDVVKNATYLSYMGDQGIAINTGFKKLYIKSNTSIKVNEKITFAANIQYTNNVRSGLNWGLDGNGGIFNDVSSFSPLIPKEWTFREVDEKLYYTNGSFDNPYRKLNDIDVSEIRNSFSGYFSFNYNIFKGLSFKTSIAQTYADTEYSKYVPTTIRSSFENNGEAELRSRKDRYYAYLAQLSYNFTLAKHHRISLLTGYEIKGNQFETIQNNYTDFDTDLGIYGILSAQSGSHVTPPILSYNLHKMNSAMFSANYNYKDKYLLKTSVRADASSRFGPNNKWGVFPAVAFGWRISEEKFYKDSDFLTKYMSNAKLRVSMGQAGNNQILDYLHSNTVVAGTGNFVTIIDPNLSDDFYIGTDGNVIAMHSEKLGNPDISWETTTEINVGLDLGLLQNKLNIGLDVYSRVTSNMLLDQELAMISGYSSQTLNVGKLGAKGIELSINATPVQTKDFRWNLAFNISATRSKILELGGDGNQILKGRYIGRSGTDNVMIKEGYPLGVYFGMLVEGIRNTYESNSNATNSNMWWFANEREAPYGFISFADIDGDGSAELSDRFPLAYVEPVFTGGFNQQFKYQNFDLGMSFNWSYGNDVINANFYSLASQSQGVNNKLEILHEGAYYGNQRDGYYVGPGSVYWTAGYRDTSNSELVEDGSFLRMTNLSFGYTLPARFFRKVYLKSLRVSYTVNNLFTLTRYSGYNPEVNTGSNLDTRIIGGVDISSYPLSRTHALSLSFKF